MNLPRRHDVYFTASSLWGKIGPLQKAVGCTLFDCSCFGRSESSSPPRAQRSSPGITWAQDHNTRDSDTYSGSLWTSMGNGNLVLGLRRNARFSSRGGVFPLSSYVFASVRFASAYRGKRSRKLIIRMYVRLLLRTSTICFCSKVILQRVRASPFADYQFI